MTKTWYSLHGVDLFAVGGIWRPTDEWGDAYSMVMVDGCQQMAQVHDRMPVILRAGQYEQWTDGSVEDALALARTCNDLLAVDQSVERWGRSAQRSVPGKELAMGWILAPSECVGYSLLNTPRLCRVAPTSLLFNDSTQPVGRGRRLIKAFASSILRLGVIVPGAWSSSRSA